MSQKKVERYKENKHKKNTKKKKIADFLWKVMPPIILVAIFAWIGFSAYNKYEQGKERQVISADFSGINKCVEKLDGDKDKKTEDKKDADSSEEKTENATDNK